ncbi:MAG TPA: CBS domain-containing protein [Nevskiaceae bacterium]
MSDARRAIHVRDVMAADIDLIDGMTTVAEALRGMRHVENRAWIIDKRGAEDAYGIVLISDIARQVLARDRAPDRVNMYEIMTKPVLPVDPEMGIRHCAQLFERFHLSRAPVIENGVVIGMVGAVDLVLRGLCALHDDIEAPRATRRPPFK